MKNKTKTEKEQTNTIKCACYRGYWPSGHVTGMRCIHIHRHSMISELAEATTEECK